MRLGVMFGDVAEGNPAVGEIWFEAPDGAPDDLLVKYLFTAEKLSVQVHPDDHAAQQAGKRRGKEECWLILDADPGARIGLGLTHSIDREALRAEAEDGSIEDLLDWKPVKPGDLFYLPAGTIHAIGAGVSLLEVQQNVDLTYRLYDYGRPRDLHLDEAIAVAAPGPWQAPDAAGEIAPGRAVLANGRKFVLERWHGDQAGSLAADHPLWLVPLDGTGTLDGEALEPGSAWLVTGQTRLDYHGALLLAYAGATIAPTLLS
jgi:mannose-6-phosphate isomerase